MPHSGQAVATRNRRNDFIRSLRSMGPGETCILWPWSQRNGRYVRMSSESGIMYAHRWVWEQINGPVPDGREVCHNCPGGDNPSCVRPSHLWLGTHAENIRDAYAKGRMHGNTSAHPSGEGHWAARLTTEDVLAIRRRVKAGEVQLQLAREFGLTAAAINNIVKRRAWAHVPDDD